VEVVPRLLAAGHEVHGISSRPAPHPAGVIQHVADILSPDFPRLVREIGATHLLHLAWHLPHNLFWTARENVQWVEASIRMLDAFAQAGGRRWVGAGTCAEYDWSQGGVFDESSPEGPGTLYGACKCGLRAAAQVIGRQLGVEVAWGRVFFPYGGAEKPGRLVPAVIQSLLKGESVPCTEGTQIRDYVYVEDVAEAFVTLLQSAHCGPVNIGSGAPTTVRQLALHIGEAIGRPELLKFGALPQRAFETHEIVADIGLLRSLGFEPKFSIEDGIRKTIAFWRSATVSRP
jgi:nucleoside-diphosphate-sugar epimerase